MRPINNTIRAHWDRNGKSRWVWSWDGDLVVEFTRGDIENYIDEEDVVALLSSGHTEFIFSALFSETDIDLEIVRMSSIEAGDDQTVRLLPVRGEWKKGRKKGRECDLYIVSLMVVEEDSKEFGRFRAFSDHFWKERKEREAEKSYIEELGSRTTGADAMEVGGL